MDESVLLLAVLPVVLLLGAAAEDEALVSALLDGAVLLAVLPWLLVSVLEPEVWAIDTPPARAAAAARAVNVFLVAFISVTPKWGAREDTLRVGRKTLAGCQLVSTLRPACHSGSGAIAVASVGMALSPVASPNLIRSGFARMAGLPGPSARSAKLGLRTRSPARRRRVRTASGRWCRSRRRAVGGLH